MSVQRSPTGSGLNVGRSGSYPDLANKSTTSDYIDGTHITFRNKRKLVHNEESKSDIAEIKTEFTEMRKQMLTMQNQMSELMACLTSNNNMQIENFNNLHKDISVIKEQVNNIKSTTEKLTSEQHNLKREITSMQIFRNTTEKKMESIQAKLNQINIASSSTVLQAQEEIVIELNERNLRCKNIVISDITEPVSTEPKIRREQDKSKVLSIIRQIYTDCPEPERIIRLGKYQPEKNRLLKVCFTSQETALHILKNKNIIKLNNIKIFSDQTPQQQAYMKELKEELDNRTSSGEENLRIKYVKGVPKIVIAIPKNSNF